MRSTSIVAVAVAAVLMLVISMSYGLASLTIPSRVENFSKHDWVQENLIKLHNELSWRCEIWVSDDKYCDILFYPLLFMHNKAWILTHTDIDKDLLSKAKDLSYLIRRSAIPKSELPILRIFMTDYTIEKLKKKIAIAMREREPTLLRGPDDWVTAEIISDDGSNRKMTRVKIRLKGDSSDHFDDPKKLSFRVEVGNNQLIWGMSIFSIQRPVTRRYQNEALISTMMRHIGVLAPRYFFVDVRLNDQKVGIMALEEFFTKEMVEASNRREGPIMALDEDWYWSQRFIFNNLIPRAIPAWKQNLAMWDHPIKVFQAGNFRPETINSQKMMRAVSLLRDQVDGRRDKNLAFDLNLMSLWWVTTSTWKADHGWSWINSRFYFNPITEKLEPVSFDNNFFDAPHEKLEPALLPLHYALFLQIRPWFFGMMMDNPAFAKMTRENVKKINELLSSASFRELFVSKQNQYLDFLRLDNIQRDPVRISVLIKNLSEFSAWIENIHAPIFNNPSPIHERRDNDPIHGRATLKSDIPLSTHLRPFWFWSAEGTNIEIKNLTLHPITVHSVFFSKEPENSLVPAETTIPVYQKDSNYHVFQLPIDVSAVDLSDQMQISYSYRGQQYTKPVILQFRNYESGYEGQETTRAWFEKNGVFLDQATKTIIFPQGNYSLETNLETERGWRLEFLPGTVLQFKQGSRLKVNGPVHALGREDLPVQLMITSDPTRGLIGSWGGLLVVEENRESILRHTHVTGAATQGFSERQDAHGLTGCITFYKSNVRIEYSKFIGLQCEDALNIISSDFNIDHVEFIDSSADAFDSDFSDGIVNNSVFRNIVNDGIDVSGSRVQVSSSWFSDIQDKAISVGEGSTLDATELTIDGADAGVASKDKSVVYIRNSVFKDVSNALMAYVKKEEWGPAEIHCDNCLFDHVENIAVEQYASRITVDGQEVSPTPFSRKQLQIAGYVQ